jgi:hypothetical protein
MATVIAARQEVTRAGQKAKTTGNEDGTYASALPESKEKIRFFYFF